MEYKGIRYTVRATLEREQWHVAIYPDGVETDGRVFSGTRKQAELQARFLITRWLAKRPAKPRQNSN